MNPIATIVQNNGILNNSIYYEFRLYSGLNEFLSNKYRMRTNKNTFTIFAVLLIALVLFCMTRSDGFAVVPGYDGFVSVPGYDGFAGAPGSRTATKPKTFVPTSGGRAMGQTSR